MALLKQVWGWICDHPALFFVVNGDIVWQQARTPRRELALARAWVEHQFPEQVFARSKGLYGGARWTMEWRLLTTHGQEFNERGELYVYEAEMPKPGELLGCGFYFKTQKLRREVAACLSEHGVPLHTGDIRPRVTLRWARKTKFKPRDNFWLTGWLPGRSPEQDALRVLHEKRGLDASIEAARRGEFPYELGKPEERANGLRLLEQLVRRHNWASDVLNANGQVQ